MSESSRMEKTDKPKEETAAEYMKRHELGLLRLLAEKYPEKGKQFSDQALKKKLDKSKN
jgi:hypothetical protein